MKPTPAITALLLLMLLLPACGQDQSQPAPVDISMTEIIWMGPANLNIDRLPLLAEVTSCLAKIGYARRGTPLLIVVKGGFICSGTFNWGCATPSTVYVSEAGEAMYPPEFSLFKHEMIHWGTGIASHSDPVFLTCQWTTPTSTNFIEPQP